MAKFGLCESATYSSKSPNFAADRAINLFPERIESGTGKNNFGLLGSPGTEVYALFTDGPSRAEITIPFSYPTAERMFTVQGSTLFEVFGDGDEDLGIPNTEPVARGNVGTDGFPAFMAFNGTHLAIASAQKLYLLKLSDNSFTGPIQDDNMDDLAPISVVFLNQYLLINVVATQIVMYSEPGDAETWPVLNFFSAEVDPDRCLMLLVDHVTLWCFGDSSIQPFQNTGDADNPFQAYLAAALQQGLGAPASVVPLDNGIFFLGKDPLRGGIIGWRLDGSSLRRVSNHSVEQFWETYSRTDDAIAYPMVMQGHAWWRITFQEANKTWCYDCSTNMWHELSCWNQQTAEFEAHHIITHTSAFGKHLGGSRMGDCCETEFPVEPLAGACPTAVAETGTAYDSGYIITGGTPPYTVVIISGALPDGLTLNSDGTITGTPTVAGSFSFVAQITDSGTPPQQITLECDIEVEEGGSFNAQIPLEMVITGIFDDDAETDYYAAELYIDPADYDGLVAGHFQGCFLNNGNVEIKHVDLVDEDGTVYQTLDIPKSTFSVTRFRGDFTLDPDEPHTYMFRVRAADPAAEFDLEFYDCKLLLDVEDSNRVKIQILLGAGTSSLGGTNTGSSQANNRAAYAQIAASCSYDFSGLPTIICGAATRPMLTNLWLKDSSKWATVDHWELELIAYHFQTVPCGCDANCHAALYNATSGFQVADTVVGPWSPGASPASPERMSVSFDDAAVNFDDGDEFEVKQILDPQGLPDGCNFRIARAALYVVLTGGSIKAQIYHKLSLERVGSTIFGQGSNQNFPETRYLHQPTKYNAGTTFYHELTGYSENSGGFTGGTFKGYVFDGGVDDSGTTGSNVASSDVTMSTTRSRQRTAALTLTDGNRYFARDERTGGTGLFQHGHHFLIAEVPVAP